MSAVIWFEPYHLGSAPTQEINRMDVLADKTIRTAPCPHCYVCGSPGHLLYNELKDRLFDASGIWSLRACTNDKCGLLWLDPMPIADDIHKAYETYYTHVNFAARRLSAPRRIARDLGEGYLARRYGYRDQTLSRWYRTLGWLMNLHPGAMANLDFSVFYLAAKNHGRLLEVGFGSGAMLQSMQGRGWVVEGVDVDPAAVKNASDKGLQVHLGKLEDLRLPANSYDAIAMSHVIEHVTEPSELLKECYRLLKPGGTVVVITPNIKSWGHRLYASNWLALDPPRHLHIFSSRSLCVLAQQSGIRIESLTTTIRDANGLFIASDAIRKTGKYQMGSQASSRLTYYWARALLHLEWLLMHFRRGYGEEIVLIGSK